MKNNSLFFGIILMVTLLNATMVSAQVVTIATPDSTVNSCYIKVRGTSSGVNLPMWYEVSNEKNVITDYGAFKNEANWFCIVRHLSGGNNTIKVYGAATATAITSKSIVLRVDTSGYPVVRPRPIPAELWWGGTSEMIQLRDNPTGWEFVKRYADTYFIHSAYFGGYPAISSVVTQIKPYGAKIAAELGGGSDSETTWPAKQFNQWGAGSNGWLNRLYTSTAAILTDACHDFHANVDSFTRYNPSWTQQQVVDTLAKYWERNDDLNSSVFPHLKFSITSSPVWWDWGTYKCLGGLNGIKREYYYTENGKQYNFDFATIMTAFSNNHNKRRPWTFSTDLPCTFMTNTTTYLPYNGPYLTAKSIVYESWLHSVGAKHTKICNYGSTRFMPDLDAWHKAYSDSSFLAMRIHQRENGRADNYLFESWYNYTPTGGTTIWLPSRVTPEDDPNTYTGLAKQAIKYLKGIKDVNGTLEQLSLTQSTSGTLTTFTLTNNGDIICLPNLQVFESGDKTISTQWYDASYKDISTSIKSNGGWAFTSFLNPGQSTTLYCGVTNNSTKAKEIVLEAFWNPQDPTGIVRARQILSINKVSGVDQVSTDKTVEIYPNPARDNVTIKSENGKCPLSVYNSMGSLVYFVPNFENQITIPTSKIGEKGVYFVKANYTVKKLIIGK